MRKILPALILFTIFSNSLFAQLPTISYSNPQNYTANTAISPLVPVSSKVATQGYSSIPVLTGPQFGAVRNIAVDGQGNIYAIDGVNRAIKKITAGGSLAITIASGFGALNGLALDLKGNVYVTDDGTGLVKEVPVNGSPVITLASGFISPQGIAVDAAGNIYVADAGNGSVKEIPANGGAAILIGPSFNGPTGVAVDAAGNIYVTESYGIDVKEIPANGTPVITISSGFKSPQGIAIDASGNIFVDDNGNNAVKEILAGSHAVVTIGSGFNQPLSVATGLAGDIYVSDNAKQIKEIVPAGGYYLNVPLPAGLIFNNATGVISGTPLTVSPATNYLVTAYNSSGDHAATVNIAVSKAQAPTIGYSSPDTYMVGTAVSPLVPVSSKVTAAAYSSSPISFGPRFSSASAIAADFLGNVYTIDAANKAVKKIPVNGGAVTTIGSGFIQPFGLATDAAGNVYVLDAGSGTGTAKIYKVPASGGATVTIASGLGVPGCISVDAAGNIYVSDAGVLKEVPVNGGAIFTLSTPPIAPTGVAADASGNIYFTEPNYAKVFKVPASGGTPIAVGFGFVQPQGVAVDASGNVFVTDNGNNTVTEIQASGGAMVPIGSGFNQPYGVAAGPSGNIYISDNSSQRKEIIPVGGYYLTAPLPSGLNFSNVTGIISGTPTVVSPATNYTVTAYNSGTPATATVNIKVLPSSNAALASLSISSGTLTPGFAAGKVSYMASVGNAITSVTVTPAAAGTGATINVNGTAVTSGTASRPIQLSAGLNTITIVVTAQDGKTTGTYAVTLTRARSSVATLANLAVSSGTLSPSFKTGTTVYTASVANAITSITVAPTVTDTTATITVNGKTVTSGTASAPIPLNLGTDTLTTIVTAQDGITKATYKVIVTRLRSSVATLANLAVSSGTLSPSFSTGTTSYAAIVASTTTSITVTPTTTDTLATVTVNGKAVTSGSISKPVLLSLGSNIITTVVTAPDGVTKDTYMLTVTSVPSATISYSSPQNYMVKTPLSPLVPTSSNVAAHGYSSSPVLVGPQFTSVGRIAVDVQGNIYAVDGAKGTVNKIPANGGPAITIAAGIGYTNGLAIDVKGNVYVTDAETGVVKEIPASGGPVITLATGFISPQGIAADNQGNVYVADAGNGSVKEIPADGGPVVGTGYSFNNPSGVAVDVMGNVYVAESSGNDVKEILANGAGFSTLATGFNAPQGVAVDVSGNVFVDDYGNNAVKEIQADSNVVITIGSGFNQPFSVAAGPAGNIYIADKLSQIKKLIPAGGYYLTVPLPAGLIFSNATGIISGMPKTVSPATNYTVTAYNSGTSATATVNIKVLPSANASLAFLNISSGTIMPEFVSNTTNYTVSIANTVTSITVTSSTADSNATVILNGKIVIRGAASDPIKLTTGKNTIAIVVTAQDGKTTETYTLTINRPQFPPAISYTGPQTYTTGIAVKPLSPTASGVAAPAYNSSTVTFASGFNTPAKVAIDAKGDFYVADYGNNVIKKIKAGGGTPVIIGSGFKNPTGVAVDAAGNVYVADAGNNAVKKIPAAGGNAVTIGSGFNQPADVAVDALGNVYVADAGNNAIKKIPVGSSAPVTLGLGFNDPFGIALDASGNVYFTDGNNGLYKIPVGGGYVVTIATGLNNPNGVAVDPSGNIYVADSGNGVIEMFPANGGPRVALGNNVGLPFYVAVDASGNLYVTDETNNVLHQIIPVGGYYLSTALPAGLGFSNSTGTISGTPTAVSPVTNYNITAYNLNGGSTATVTLTVKAPSNNTALTSFTDNYNDTYTGALINGFWCDSTVVSSTVTSLGFIAVTADPNATITINGIAVANGKVSAPFPLTANAVTFFTLVVTAADGFTKQTYPITVKKGPSNNTALTSLLANNNVTLSGAEVNGYWTMSATVGASVSSLSFTPTTANRDAKVTINGTAVAYNMASAAIPINVSGTTNITLIVTAPDEVTKQTYPIVITKSGTNLSLRITDVLPDIFKTDSTVVANNILSPNGDGVNDTWMVRNIDLYPNNSVTVYDRIGHVVFTKKGYANDWAGTYGGSILNQGTYYYLLDLGNGSTSLKGFITVVRDR